MLEFKRRNKLFRKLLLILVVPVFLGASTVQITFDGTGGVSDGSDYVLPYYLQINGGPTFAATCFDPFDNITPGQTWTANIDTLSQAVATGRFSSDPNALNGYELIGVLSTLSAPTAQAAIDLQHDIWNVFDPGAYAVDSDMSNYLVIANSELSTFDFSTVEYIEPVVGQGTQAFVAPSSPEPASIGLLGLGLLMAGLIRRKCKNV